LIEAAGQDDPPGVGGEQDRNAHPDRAEPVGAAEATEWRE